VTATVLDGQVLARRIQAELTPRVAEFSRQTGIRPCLAAVLVGEDAGSEVYVRNKRNACERCGLEGQLHRLPATTSLEPLLVLVEQLNRDPRVHGILVQLPLPVGLDAMRVLHAVSPFKDVDGFHPENVGRLVQGAPRFVPCTPQAVLEILKRHELPVAGQHAVILGRSEIVGKPLANLLMQRGLDATVTVCHSRTRDLAELTRQADLLIAAIGHPQFVQAAMVKPGAVVIDVGINRTPAGLVGDVDYEAVRQVARAITPVPKGVGPLTVTMLLANTLRAAQLANPR